MQIIISGKCLPCTSYVPANVDIERGKVFDDHAGSPFHRCGTCGQAMGNVTHSDRVALLLCLPSDDVHRELHRSTTINNERCHREQKKTAENADKVGVYISTHQVSFPPVLNSG